eukprot:333996-Pelagomonas_calceolata.AAC.1
MFTVTAHASHVLRPLGSPFLQTELSLRGLRGCMTFLAGLVNAVSSREGLLMHLPDLKDTHKANMHAEHKLKQAEREHHKHKVTTGCKDVSNCKECSRKWLEVVIHGV